MKATKIILLAVALITCTNNFSWAQSGNVKIELTQATEQLLTAFYTENFDEVIRLMHASCKARTVNMFIDEYSNAIKTNSVQSFNNRSGITSSIEVYKSMDYDNVLKVLLKSHPRMGIIKRWNDGRKNNSIELKIKSIENDVPDTYWVYFELKLPYEQKTIIQNSHIVWTRENGRWQVSSADLVVFAGYFSDNK